MYLDLGAHIPFIRSFTLDSNFPFEIPFYPNSNIPYHFMFDFYTGTLEYFGLRIDLAYNAISALTLTSLLFICMDFGKMFFKKSMIGLVAFILFIFPFNFSFFEVVKTGIFQLWRNQAYNFNSFLGESTVGNFLYINTYLNQRHLIFSLSVSLVLLLFILQIGKMERGKKHTLRLILLGVLASLLFLWNISIFGMLLLLIFLCIFILKKRRDLIVICLSTCICFIFQALPFVSSNSRTLVFSPGYLIYNNLSLQNFLLFWILNLGLVIVFVIGGFLISNRFQKGFFLILIPIFILPNLFKFTSDMFDNHKFFNFWYLYMCFYAAYFLVFLYSKSNIFKFLSFAIFVCAIFTSLSNMAVVKNDIYASIPDYKEKDLVKYITKVDLNGDLIVTNGEIYDPLSISGIDTYLGRSHYIYLYGGAPEERVRKKQKILNPPMECEALVDNTVSIKYIIVYKDVSVKNLQLTNTDALKKLYKKIYEDDFGIIFKI